MNADLSPECASPLGQVCAIMNCLMPVNMLQISDLKKKEMSGSIAFGSSTDEQPRSAIGGVRKPPGGGSSLSFGDSSAQGSNGDSAPSRKAPGGQSSFSFGW